MVVKYENIENPMRDRCWLWEKLHHIPLLKDADFISIEVWLINFSCIVCERTLSIGRPGAPNVLLFQPSILYRQIYKMKKLT